MTTVQRINSERAMLLGWGRAILLQLAHPLVAAGVHDHSAFHGGALEAASRLHHTVSAMLALTFGDDGRRATTIAHIRAIHREVHGHLRVDAGPFPAGTFYSAEDPALLLWVHATLLDSTVDLYQRVVSPLAPSDRDAYCAESVPALEALGGDAAAAPRTWAALQEYMGAMLNGPLLTVTADAREICLAVLAPRIGLAGRPLAGFQRLVTSGLLPARIREAYGLPWDERRERRFHRALGIIRTLQHAAPRAVTQWRDARRLGSFKHPAAGVSHVRDEATAGNDGRPEHQ